MYIARELGKYGITVNAYAPGPVESVLSQFLCSMFPAHLKTFHSTADELKARFGADTLSAVSILWNRAIDFI